MTIINYLSADGTQCTFDLPEGISLMHGAVMNGVDGIVGECGGNAMCATCHIYIQEVDLDKLAPIGELEDEMLENTASPRRANSRLACQIEVRAELDGLTVHLPERQY